MFAPRFLKFSTLLASYQNWRAERIRIKHAQNYARGRAYAFECLRSGMLRPEIHLEACIDTASTFGDFNEFDQGIKEVLQEWYGARKRVMAERPLVRTRENTDGWTVV